MATKEPTRLGDWQIEQEIDEILLRFELIEIPGARYLFNDIVELCQRAIKRHERTLRRHGLLVETKQTELEKKEEETHA